MFEKLEGVVKRFEAVTQSLSDPEVTKDQDNYRALSREHSELTPIVEAYARYSKVRTDLDEQEAILADPAEDPDLKELAEGEVYDLREQIEALSEELKTLLLPKDPLDNNNIILEIRAGAGGDEASLFAGTLVKMYLRYAEIMGWKTDVLTSSPSEVGGFKEVVVEMDGNEVYKNLKFESGVHRVQRVPQTESQGRIHTSTVTVAVLPQAEDVEINISPSDLRIDVFRASGPGGQSVNTTDSAVRITHIPTGTVATSQDEKSQHKNKAKALKVLSARIYEKVLEEKTRETAEARRGMVGTGDRSERIRTYNFPQGRITDHRINLTLYKMEAMLNGELDEMTEALQAHDKAMLLQHNE